MKIVCFGNSLTTCGGDGGRVSDILQDRFPGHTFVNKGVGGESFVEAMQRFDNDVLAERPDVVLIELGANDWWRNERPVAAWAADLEDCVVRIKKAGGRAVILGVFGLYRDDAGQLVPKVYGIDERAVAYRAEEARIASEHGCPYVPNVQETIINRRRCWCDSNHPNEYGNRHAADMVEPALEDLLGQRAAPIRKPVLNTTRDFWREAVELAPDKPAVIDGDRRVETSRWLVSETPHRGVSTSRGGGIMLTYRQADELVERLAAGIFDATGVIRPKVAIYLPNGIEYFLIYWAVQRLGGVVVPLNTWLKEDSLTGIFQNVRPDVLFVRSQHDAAPIRAALAIPRTLVVATEHDDHGLRMFDSLLKTAGRAPDVDIEPDGLSIVMHTSGTTATPKGGMMRHSDLMFNVAAAINAHGFSPNDVHLLVNPMFHCTALYSSLPAAAYQKSPVVIVASTAADDLLDVVQRERITTFLSIPTIFQKIVMAKNLDQYDTSSLRVMAFAGSLMPVNTVRELRQRFPNVALHNFFGLTETISMTHVLRNEDVEAHPDSIGRLLPFVDAKIVDEQDADVPPGTVGELLFAREEVIPGYYNQSDRLQESIVELGGRAWFRTGDLAAVDQDGFFFIKGRKKDMIIVGGENVFAAEVESVLMAHPHVREAVVKGVPATGLRAHLGELVKAYVVPRSCQLTEIDLRKHCYDKLPSYKVPQVMVFMEELPRNPSGKVVKDELPYKTTKAPGLRLAA